MYYHDIDDIDRILRWARDKPWFNVDVFVGIEAWYLEKGFLTFQQEVAIENVITRFKIPKTHEPSWEK